MKEEFQIDDMRIAPKQSGGHWTVAEYKALDFAREEDWQTAIQMFEDRIRNRFLEMVDRIEDCSYAGFAVMALDCLLIETLEQFRKGKAETPRQQSRKYFVDFLTRTAFSKFFDKRTAGLFYSHIRCGILHQAEIKGSSRLRIDKPEMVTEVEGGLIINRRSFHNKLVEVFEDYLRDLREGKDLSLRENFRKKMDAICRINR